MARRVTNEPQPASSTFEHMHTLQTLRPMTDAERAKAPPVWHPMVRGASGDKTQVALHQPIYNDQIEGMANDEAIALIAELAAFAGSRSSPTRTVGKLTPW